jgi:hypothetical protein
MRQLETSFAEEAVDVCEDDDVTLEASSLAAAMVDVVASVAGLVVSTAPLLGDHKDADDAGFKLARFREMPSKDTRKRTYSEATI